MGESLKCPKLHQLCGLSRGHYSLLHELNIKKLYNNGSLLEIYPKLIFFA
jgi:hypothetical protein